MIRDVDESVAAWLGALVPQAAVSFDPPGASQSLGTASGEAPHQAPGKSRAGSGSRAGSPAVSLSVFLASVRLEGDASTSGWVPLRAEDGAVSGLLPPERRYRFTYLLVAEGPDTVSEHDVLGRVLLGSALSHVLPREYLRGIMTRASDEVLQHCAPDAVGVDPQHLWSAWGAIPRTALELSVLAPMPLDAVDVTVAPPSHIELGARRTPPPAPASTPAPRPRPTSRIEEG